MNAVQFFDSEELQEIRDRFYYVDEDFRGKKRIFMDNAGGSLRLKAAEQVFHQVDAIPDCSEHSNEAAKYLDQFEQNTKKELMEVVFGAEKGSLYPGLTASALIFDLVRVVSEHAGGTNFVTTVLEHPSAYDAIHYYGGLHGKEVRVAGANKVSGGVEAEDILKLIDKDTSILCCMAASNISGFVYDLETVCREARKINPDIYIMVDAVQHAPHGWLNPEELGVDTMHFAPYKFFGVRGFGIAYVSERVNTFMHHRLLGSPADNWSLGSPAPAHFAAVHEIIDYVCSLGAKICPAEASRREKFKTGMDRIAAHERALLNLALNGDETTQGLRQLTGINVIMDGAPVEGRDFIIGIEFKNMTCEQATAEYEKRGIIVFERSASSIYSKRMLDAFDSEGCVRISPLHPNTPAEIREFLRVTAEIAAL